MTDMKELRDTMDRGFEAVGVRCEKLSDEIRGVERKVIALDTKWGEHMHTHKRVDDRLEGLEGREREGTGRVDISKVKKDSDPPKKNGRLNGSTVKSYLMIGFFVGVGILTAVNTFSTPSTEDLERVAKRQDSVVAAVENEIEPLRKEKEAAEQDREAMREALRLLQLYLEPSAGGRGGNP